MNRLHYILLTLVLFVSCSTDRVIDLNPGREIEFRVIATKGDVLDMGKFKVFRLYAFREDGSLYYEDTYRFNGESFTSDKKHMWPSSGENIYFQAYHQFGTQTSGEEDSSSGKLTLQGFSTGDNISTQVDLVCATASGNKNVSGAVGLAFEHSLSQVEIKAKNTNPNYICEVLGLRIANVVANADLDVKNSHWDHSATDSYEVIYDTPRLLGEQSITLMSAADDNALLIPQTLTPWIPELDNTNEAGGALFAVKVRITTADTGSKIYPVVDGVDNDWIALPIEGEWKAGFKYIYTWNIPDVCGYVDPYKASDPVDMLLFPPGIPVRGEQITLINPAVQYWSNDYIYL